MKKQEFDMEDNKITEYASSKNNKEGITKNILCVDAKKYIGSQDTTIGFYSGDELENSDCIYNFSDNAKHFVEKELKIFRYSRHYLIRSIGDIFSLNKYYGASVTYKWVIPDYCDKICNEFNIADRMYYILAKAIMLEIADGFNNIDYWKYSELMKYPDKLFYNWDIYTSTEDYKFYNINKLDDNLDSAGFKVRYVKFYFETKAHYTIGTPMHIGLHNKNSVCKNVDFTFNTTCIDEAVKKLEEINKLKDEIE